MVINGSFIDLSAIAKMMAYNGGSALPASDSKPTGRIIQNGQLLDGPSEPDRFYFAQTVCGEDSFGTGKGDPPPASCFGMGGLAPILMNGLPFGTTNRYRSDVPAGAPVTGSVGAKYLPYLTQKSNAMFAGMQGSGATGGKTAIGFSRSKHCLLVLVQQAGEHGLTAADYGAVFAKVKAENAVFLDGSDSATLYYDGNFLVTPGRAKNNFLTVAIGFK